MARVQLDLDGNFGELFPKLKEAATAQDTLVAKTKVAKNELNEMFSQPSKQANAFSQVLTDASKNISRSIDDMALQLKAYSVAQEQAVKGSQEFQITQEQIKLLQKDIVALAAATVDEANKFAEGSSKKQLALQEEIAKLKELNELSKLPGVNRNDITKQIADQTRQVQSLTAELKKEKAAQDALSKPSASGAPSASGPGPGDVEKIKSFRTQLKEAMLDAQKAQAQFNKGLLSKEQLDIELRKVATLKEEISDFNETVEALNPEKKLAAFSQLTSSITGGFTAATGVMAVFGVESENVQKQLLKVQGALAISQGINQLLGAGDAFKNISLVLQGFTNKLLINTAVKSANTGATVTNTAAQSASATVTALVSGEIGVATAATYLWNLAIKALMGPLGLVLIAIGAAIGILASFSDEVDMSADRIKQLGESFEASIDQEKKWTDNRKKLSEQRVDILEAELETSLEKMRAHGASEAAIEAARTKNAERVFNERQELLQADIEAQTREEEARNKELERLAEQRAALFTSDHTGFFGGVDKEAVAANDAQQQAQLDKLAELAQKKKELGNQQLLDETNFNKDSAKNEADANQKNLEAEKKHAEDLLKLKTDLTNALKDLQDKADKASLEQTSGQSRIDAERSLALKQIEDLRAVIKKKGDEEAKSRGEQFAFSVEQEQQFATLKLLVEKKFFTDSAALAIANQKVLIENTESGLKKELDLYDLAFKEIEKKLRDAGATELQIETVKNQGRVEIRKTYALKQIDLENETNKKIIDSINIAGVNEAQAERIRNEKRLQEDLLAANKKLNTLESSITLVDDKDLEKQIQQAKARIKELEAAIVKGQNDIKSHEGDVSLAALFGVDPEHRDAANEAFQEVFTQSLELLSQIISAKEEAVNRELELNQQSIDSYQNKIDTLDSQIDKETELNKRGLANNLDKVKKERAAIEADRQRDLASRKQLLAEKKKLAKEQLVVDTATQVSALAVTIANLFQSFSSLPLGIGILLAVAAAAAVVAEFYSFKSQLDAINSQELGEGGWIDGKKHTDGGEKYYSNKTPGKVKELEDGEFVSKSKVAAKHGPLLEKINNERYEQINESDLHLILKKANISLSNESDPAPSTSPKRTIEPKRTETNRITITDLQKIVDKKNLVEERKAVFSESITRKDFQSLTLHELRQILNTTNVKNENRLSISDRERNSLVQVVNQKNFLSDNYAVEKLYPFLHDMKIGFNPKTAKEVTKQNQQLHGYQVQYNNNTNVERLERQLAIVVDELQVHRQERENSEHVFTHADGTVEIRKGSKTTLIRP